MKVVACGKFVVDTINQTVRVPRIYGILQGTLTNSATGDIVEAGLPNITGKADNFRSGNGADTSFSGAMTYTYTTDWPNNNSKATDRTYYGGIKFDASRSWTGETSQNGTHNHTVDIADTGGGQAHNNLPPYLAMYMWQRVK